MKCPACGDEETVEGRTHEGPAPLYFLPKGARLLSLTTGIPSRAPLRACTRCGLLWSQREPAELRRYIKDTAQR